MFWSKKPLKTIPTGVPYEWIPTNGYLFTLQHLDGYRCSACRLIVTNYLEDSPPNIMQKAMSSNQDDRS